MRQVNTETRRIRECQAKLEQAFRKTAKRRVDKTGNRDDNWRRDVCVFKCLCVFVPLFVSKLWKLAHTPSDRQTKTRQRRQSWCRFVVHRH